MRISSLTLGPVETNCYFIENEDGIIIVDPAGESGQIIKKVNQLNKTVKAVLLTHAHFDHIAALDDIVEKYQVPVYMSAIEFDFLVNTEKNGSAKFKQFGLPEVLPAFLYSFNLVWISAIYLLTLGPSVPTGITTTSTIAII